MVILNLPPQKKEHFLLSKKDWLFNKDPYNGL